MVQSSALAKYETIWATYESEYNNMEGVKRVRDKQEKLNHAKIECETKYKSEFKLLYCC